MLETYRSLFSAYQLDLSEEQYQLLSQYAALLHDETPVQNVTAVSEISDIWVRHFLDSAYLLHHIGGDASKVIDIGTGGGIPGIPLAILRPDLDITLLDSELRKIEFCTMAVQKLGLSDRVHPICGRAEELAKSADYREKFDMAVSRAMANGSMLTELSLPFVKVGGVLLAMKGRGYDPTVERFAEAAPLVGGIACEPVPYTLESEQKFLICVKKQSPTPPQYPRRFAKIKRQPL